MGLLSSVRCGAVRCFSLLFGVVLRLVQTPERNLNRLSGAGSIERTLLLLPQLEQVQLDQAQLDQVQLVLSKSGQALAAWITPPPRHTSPSYSTALCPGVTAHWS